MKPAVKKLKKVTLKPAVKTQASKPVSTGLKKTDPEFYKKVGLISAAKRKESGTITHEQLSAWAHKSHERR